MTSHGDIFHFGVRPRSRIRSGARVRASFQEKITRLVHRLRSPPRLVGRLGSEVRVGASFQIFSKGVPYFRENNFKGSSHRTKNEKQHNCSHWTSR